MYKSGYTIKMFQLLEDDFEKFCKYIPPNYYSESERKQIYSPVLSDLLIRIGSQIDSFLRNWDVVRNLNEGVDRLNMGHFKNIESTTNLGEKKITFLPTFLQTDLQENEIIQPFKDWKTEPIVWWNAYNNVKHNGYDSRKHGNLQNVIDSLAALFILNCSHEYLIGKLVEYKYTKVDSDLYTSMMKHEQPVTFRNTTFSSNLFEFTQNEDVYFPDKGIAPKPLFFDSSIIK